MAIDYTDSRSYGISQWRLRKPVVIRWVASGETPTVVWAQNDDARSDTSVGAWSNQSGFDVIFYFSENINQFGWTNDPEDLRWIGTHELGHALDLNHSNPDYNAYGSVMISHRRGGSNKPHYPVAWTCYGSVD